MAGADYRISRDLYGDLLRDLRRRDWTLMSERFAKAQVLGYDTPDADGSVDYVLKPKPKRGWRFWRR